jgi:hypothetical protein
MMFAGLDLTALTIPQIVLFLGTLSVVVMFLTIVARTFNPE